MPPVNISRRNRQRPLSASEAADALALADHVRAADGTDALSEQYRLAIEARDVDRVEHLLTYAEEPALAGYAQVRSGADSEPPSAELLVAPEARRSGVASALLDALPADVRVWSHGGGAPAEGFAAARGLTSVRALHVMHRSLVDGPPWPKAAVPDGYVVRPFEPGRDEDTWLAVNAAAFAHHPEQGSLDRGDLEQRMGQPWFEAGGLILVVSRADPDRIAAFHWTKVDPPDGTRGEVYVVGVSPDRQGEGLGRTVTILGLDHLRARGLDDVVLYVDEDNVAAVHTYRRLGFEDLEVHRQYSRAHGG